METLVAPSPAVESPMENSVVVFPEGLVGLPAARRFEFLTAPELEPLLRMRCLDTPGLSFLLVDPTLVDPDYRPAFSAKDLALAGIGETDARLVLAIACVARSASDSTANFLAPLLINPAKLRGRQVILDPEKYSSRQALIPKGE